MGTADIIPGVSGGTIALITGIYERLVHAISSIDLRFISRFIKRDFDGAKKNIRNIDFQLFIPLLIGIALAIILMSRVMDYFLQNFEAPTYAFFFGLILASAVLLYPRGRWLFIWLFFRRFRSVTNRGFIIHSVTYCISFRYDCYMRYDPARYLRCIYTAVLGYV